MAGYFVRLLMAVLLTGLARAFPPGAPLLLLLLLLSIGLLLTVQLGCGLLHMR
jgi:hypothetical protein